ncbi:MAG: metallophosphoesterase, partial [Bacteroidota bacterium]|nr:metallophosphoesterase [Bacteroidota bacterium]
MKLFKLLIFNICFTNSFFSQGELILQNINSENKPWTDTLINDSEQKFTFAVVTDRTGGHRKGVWQKGVEKLNLMQPAFVVSVGDLIEGYTENIRQINKQWNEFNEMVNQLEMPFFYVAGNHDYTN